MNYNIAKYIFPLSAIILMGSGCIVFGKPKVVDTSYLKDASAFSKPSTTTLPTDERKYVPPPAAPPPPAPAPAPQPQTSQAAPTAGSAASPPSGAAVAPASGTAVPVPPTYNRPQSSDLEYNEAINIYRKSGYYIEFIKCRGNPFTITIKKNDRLMIDNRDNLTHNIIIGSNLYELAPYDFTIVRAPSTPLNYNVMCDGVTGAILKVQP